MDTYSYVSKLIKNKNFTLNLIGNISGTIFAFFFKDMKLATFLKTLSKYSLIALCCFTSIGVGAKKQIKIKKLESLPAQTTPKQPFSIENILSDFSPPKKQKSSNDKTKAIQPKDYFAENMQAFAEDDPWEQY